MSLKQQEIKKAIKQEYIRCAKDPVYFMKKYCFIQHPNKGRILFNLFPFQEKVLNIFKKEKFTITLKSRQLGISTLVAAYTIWLMLFHKDKNILALATTQATARNLVRKVQFMYENLPKWLKMPTEENNKLSLVLKNGSRIRAASSNSDASRSEAVSLLIIDEAAFIDNIEETFTSAQQTLATGGQCIAISTPNGVGNWFHQTYTKAQSKENSFIPLKLDWKVHPERNQSWRDQQDADLGPKMAAQECDADFMSSGHTVFESEDLTYYEQLQVEEPIEKRGYEGGLWIWKQPDYTRSYMISADVARGDSTDYSAFHIIDLEDAEQVAEYRGKISPKDFGNLLVGVGTEYNDALLVIENANVGWATVEQVIERDYDNLFYSNKSQNETVESYLRKYERGDLVPGFTTSSRTRPLFIPKLEEYMRERSVTIKSKRLLEELRVFVWKNGKPQAHTGYNDDLVISFAIGLYVRDTALKMRQQGMDLTRQQLKSFTQLNTREPTIRTSTSTGRDPFKMDVNGRKEDISWLI